MTKINYHTDKDWKPNYWYVVPIHGGLFELPNDGKTNIPTMWGIAMLDIVSPNEDDRDMEIMANDMTYFNALEICVKHNGVMDDIKKGNSNVKN